MDKNKLITPKQTEYIVNMTQRETHNYEHVVVTSFIKPSFKIKYQIEIDPPKILQIIYKDIKRPLTKYWASQIITMCENKNCKIELWTKKAK